MVSRACEKFATKFYLEGICPEAEIPYLAYVFERWFGRITTYGSLLLIIFVLGLRDVTSIIPSFLFLAFYIVHRKYAGGYHARTHLGCYIASISIFLIGTIVIVPLFTLFPIIVVASLAICLLSTFLFAPYVHPHMYCPVESRIRLKKAVKQATTLLFFVVFLMLIGGFEIYAASSTSGLSLSTICLFIPIIKERGVSNHERQKRKK